MNKKYFRLKPECFLTIGLKRSVIQNLFSGQALWLDEQNTEAVAKSEYNQPIEADRSIFQELFKNGWGFFSDNKVFVDKIRPINVFREKKLWKETPYINLGVLQLTNACNLNCTFCGKVFCPICKKMKEEPGAAEALTLDSWLRIIDTLKHFGVKNLILTGGNPLLFDGINQIIDRALKHDILVQLHTNGLIPPDNLNRNISLSILASRQEDMGRIIDNFHKFDIVTLFLMNFNIDNAKLKIPNTWHVIATGDKAPVITKNSLAKMDFDLFFARRLNNNCLNARMYVTYNGNVVPCFNHNTEVIGNIITGNFSGVLKQLINEYWNVPVDQVPDRKCTICEFKYACLACRFLDVKQNCTYDIEKAQWG